MKMKIGTLTIYYILYNNLLINEILSTIVVFSKSDIKNFWEWSTFENDNFNSTDLPTISKLSLFYIKLKLRIGSLLI